MAERFKRVQQLWDRLTTIPWIGEPIASNLPWALLLLVFGVLAGLVLKLIGWMSLAVVLSALGGILIGAAMMWVAERSLRERHASEAESALDDAQRLLEIDDNLFRGQRALAGRSVNEAEAKTHIREVLQNITDYYVDDVIRASVYLPEADALACWTGYLMPEESITNRRFPYRVDTGRPRGVALVAFETGELKVQEFSKEKATKRWVAKQQDYIEFEPGRRNRPYREFVAIPLMIGESAIGVVCFDSRNPGAFDLRNTQIRSELVRLGERVTAALLSVRPDLVVPLGPMS